MIQGTVCRIDTPIEVEIVVAPNDIQLDASRSGAYILTSNDETISDLESRLQEYCSSEQRSL